MRDEYIINADPNFIKEFEEKFKVKIVSKIKGNDSWGSSYIFCDDGREDEYGLDLEMFEILLWDKESYETENNYYQFNYSSITGNYNFETEESHAFIGNEESALLKEGDNLIWDDYCSDVVKFLEESEKKYPVIFNNSPNET